MIKYSFIFFSLALIGCASEKNSPPTIFAGEIVNPTNQTIVLYKDDMVVDSTHLDKNNRFELKLNNLEEGLYNFHNSGQYQYVYLSEGDSIQIRLNRIYFDESLVFSGKGEEFNNFLIELFLDNEEEEKLVNSYYNLKPKAFATKIDSLRQNKLKLLQELQSEVTLSPKSLNLANASINYGSYLSKENYPINHIYTKKEGEPENIINGYYDYRKNLDFNNKDLTFFTPYYDFMKRHFDNLAYADCVSACENGTIGIKDQLHFNRHKLQLIDSLAKEKQLRDNLFRNVAMTYLLKVHDSVSNNKIFLDDFHKLSINNKHNAEIHELYDAVNNLQPRHNLPDVSVMDSIENSISIKEIATSNNKVVFYFWTDANPRHYINITNQIAKLSALDSSIKFVGLSLSEEAESWKNVINRNKQNFKNQYRAKNIADLRQKLVIDGLNKAIIIQDGVILDGFKNIYTMN